MSRLTSAFRVLRRLSQWNESRWNRLEKLVEPKSAKNPGNAKSAISPEDQKAIIELLNAGQLDRVIEALATRLRLTHEATLKSLCMAAGASFLPDARVENLAGTPERIRVGAGTFIRGELLVFRFGGQLTVGDHCYLGENSRVWAGESTTIGNHVLISHDVFITDCNAHEFDAAERASTFQRIVSQGHPQEKGSVETKPVVIEDHVWINPQSVILPGVRLGKGCIVGAGSIVTRDLPPYVLAAGNPAVVIKELPQPVTA